MLSVIVPTYNERNNITVLIERVMTALDELPEAAELLIVDDDSPDGTAQVAMDAARAGGWGERVRVMVRREDRGLAKAVVAGFEAARGQLLAVMDADLSHPPELLPALWRAVREQGAEVAVASRYVPGGGTRGWPLLRRVISRGACLLARPLVAVRDSTSGYFLLDRGRLDAAELRPRGYKILLELLVRTGARAVAEVPFEFRDRAAGESKLGGAVMLAYLVQLASLLRWRHPISVGYLQFAMVGLLGMAVDAAVFALAYWYLGLSVLGASLGGFLAQSLSFLAAAWFNFLLNGQWTFRERRAQARWSVFLAVSLAGFALRSLVFEALVGSGAVAPPASMLALPAESLALFAAIVVASVWNYFGSRSWAFPGDGQEPAAGSPPDQASVGWLSLALLAALALKLAFAAGTGLSADEAYYWQWSRNLDWGYHDHPPMIAYVIAAGTRMLGETELGVRLFPVLAAVVLGLMVFRLARDYAGSSFAGLWAALALLAAPLFAVGGPLATPDAPLLFFWLATLSLVVEALRHGGKRYWLLAGLTLGLGLLSKYSMVLLAVSLLVSLLVLPRGRQALARPAPWLGMAVAAAVCLPLLAWNLQRGMASVGFQLRHGLAGGGEVGPGQGLLQLAELLAGQVLVLTPVLFAVMLWPIVAALRERPLAAVGGPLSPREWHWLLFTPALLTLGVFAAASLSAESEANWAAPAWLSLLVPVGAALSRMSGWSRRRRLAARLGALLLPAALSGYFYLETLYPMGPYRGGPFEKLREREPLGEWAAQLRRSTPGAAAAPVMAANYKLASLLAFYLPDRPATQAPFETGSGSAYHEWFRPDCAAEAAWYFSNRPDLERIAELFREYRLVDRFEDRRNGVVQGRVHAYFGRLVPGRDCSAAARDQK